MPIKKAREIPQPLVHAIEKFKSWRQSRSSGSRIPKSMWQLAAKVAGQVGIHRTARALALDYYGLARRVRDQQGNPASEFAAGRSTATPVSFVEFSTAMPSSLAECLVELEDRSGKRIKIQLRGVDVATVTTLGCRLWKGE
jgi:hypothetical protein